MLKSIWESEVPLAEREPLQENTKVQTVIIGAGMTGILTAYFLQKKGQEVIVVEAKKIAGGQTCRTTAKITSQHALCYDKLIRKIGREKAGAYAMAHEEAIRIYEQIIAKEKIQCDFKKKPAYLYTVQAAGVEELLKEAAAAKSLGIRARFQEGAEITELPFEVMGGVCFENQAQFHPVKFMKHLADKITIYENTKVLAVKGHMVHTDRGSIKADNIVFATHYPITNIPGFYFLRQHQEKSYVLALSEQKELSGMYYGIDPNGLSLRSAGEILLLGGGGHRTGKNRCKDTCENRITGYTYLRKMAQVYYPDAEEIAAWSAQDCMSHDGVAFIGRYSLLRPYWYAATGFKKWGMTSAMVAAIIISSRICGTSASYEKVFTPGRFLFRASVKNLLLDIGESAQGLVKGLFSKREHRCPHMGCRLEWNAEEGSWECPCHGSGFEYTGELRDSPAQTDLRKRK